MKKILKRIGLCASFAALVWFVGLLSDRHTLHEELIRLHVLANSDSQSDQQIKLKVRDAVVESLTREMENIRDMEQARSYIRENLPKIQKTANEVLETLGCEERATVSLGQEAFDTRYYDTFTLPAGVYESLRITIGEGRGKNWWCVVFPSFCLPATTEGFEDVAAGAGFSERLLETLEGEEGYRIRFYFLDVLGKLEGMLHNG